MDSSEIAVRAHDGGVWLPSLGFAVNTVVDGLPSLVTHPLALRRLGRRRGVLAAEATWARAFPRARAHRIHAPVGQPLVLGPLHGLLFPDPEIVGVVHARVLSAGLEVIHVTLPPGPPDGLDQLLADAEPDLVLAGPDDREGVFDGSVLAGLPAGWAAAPRVLYGSRAMRDDPTPEREQLLGARILRPATQGSLF